MRSAAAARSPRAPAERMARTRSNSRDPVVGSAADLTWASGTLVLAIAKNLAPDAPQTTVPMLRVRQTPKLYAAHGQTADLCARRRVGRCRTLTPCSAPRVRPCDFEIRIPTCGGVAGVVAPIIGMQPPDIQIWILEGPGPGFVKEARAVLPGRPHLDRRIGQPNLVRFAPLNAGSRRAKGMARGHSAFVLLKGTDSSLAVKAA